MPLGYLNDPHSYMAYVSLVVHQRSLDTVDACIVLDVSIFPNIHACMSLTLSRRLWPNNFQLAIGQKRRTQKTT